ncbi:hypothetical protein DPMN_159522 [Dreissena polymorpha]|uniref:Uncharacterized protein n=1 Tax=Dreissena polymorpha TaxID=45954 RepID=A0A9D4EPG0_DREPO|nr:hypothetical protein DPMN_159522 [Dreissena polymorpha]
MIEHDGQPGTHRVDHGSHHPSRYALSKRACIQVAVQMWTTLAKYPLICMLTSKTAPSTCSHVFQWTGTKFNLGRDIIRTHFLTKFLEDWARNVTQFGFLSVHMVSLLPYKLPRPHIGNFFQRSGSVFELVVDIVKIADQLPWVYSVGGILGCDGWTGVSVGDGLE